MDKFTKEERRIMSVWMSEMPLTEEQAESLILCSRDVVVIHTDRCRYSGRACDREQNEIPAERLIH